VIGALAFTAALELGGANCAAAANTFIVNTDQDPGPMGSQSLRQAITLANGSAGNTVQFDANLLGSTITLGGNEIDITQPMSITGPGSGKLTISGNEASRIFLVTASTGTVAFSGLTLAHGHTTGQLAGAGIAAFGTAVTLNDCIVTGNTSRNGAGIFAQDSDVTISNSRVSGNASTYVGGGIVAKCASPHCGTNLAISHSTISGNTAGQSGGGIYTYLIDGISLEQSLISGNRTTSPGGQVGGGIFIYQVQTPRIVNSTIRSAAAGESMPTSPTSCSARSPATRRMRRTATASCPELPARSRSTTASWRTTSAARARSMLLAA
jgi:hypothetical protein